MFLLVWSNLLRSRLTSLKQDKSTLLTWNVGSQILQIVQQFSDTPPYILTHPSVQTEPTIRSYNLLTFLEWHWPACFSALLELGIVCLDWVGSGWVVEGNRQLEMGANVECEELGCVVGGPFKPNKLREVRGLVWRPWINKPSEMTMRCADICHHTAPASKHKPPKPSLPCPVSHMVPPLPPSISPTLYPLPSSILSPLLFLYF